MPTYHYVHFVMGQLNYFDSFSNTLIFQACNSDVFHDSLYAASVETERANRVLKQMKSYLWSTMSIKDSQMNNFFHIRVVSQFATKQRR